MSDDNKVQVVFGVKLNELFSGLSSAQSAVKESTEQMKGHLEGLMHGVEFVGKAFAALMAIAAGGKMFADAIAGVKEVTGNAVMMGKVLGVTTSEASIFNVGLASVGATTDQAKTALMMMTRTLGSAPDKFAQLGVATKDASGNMRPMQEIMLDVNEKFAHMADGTEKNLALAQIFGRKWMEVGPVLKLTSEGLEEAEHHARALNLVVGEENVRDTLAFKKSMMGMKEVMEGVEKTIGQAVMPMLTELGQWFSEFGPTAVEVTKYAIGGLIAVLEGLKFVAYAVFTQLVAETRQWGAAVAMIGDILTKAVHRDWDGVAAAWKVGTEQIKEISDAAFDDIAKEADKTATQITKLFGDQTQTKMKGGETAPHIGKEKADPATHEHSEMSKWEAENNAAKFTYELENNLRQRSLAEDVAFWMNKAHNVEASEADKLKALAKGREAELALMKKTAADQKALDAEGVAAREKSGLDALAMLKVEAETKEALGQITKARMLEIERQLEDSRFAILVAAQKQRLQLAELDPNSSPVALQKERDKMLEIERAHNLKLAEIKKAVQVESSKYEIEFFKSIETGFNSMLDKLMSGTLRLKDVMSSAFQMISHSLTQAAAKMATDWLMAQVKMKAATVETNMAQIKGDAAAAAGAAYKAVAGIPFVGPVLAPVAAGVAYAGVMGYSMLAAEGGFDVPAGMNPITKLHEKEMVLPRAQADVIRGMAEGGGSASSKVELHVHATDAQSVARLFANNGEHIVAALRKQQRNLAYPAR